MQTKWKQLIGVLSMAVLLTGDRSALPAAEPEVNPIAGPVVLLFNDALGGLDEPQFGIFRNEDESPRDQFIEQKLMSLKTKDAQELGCLGLLYNVSGSGVYCGFWQKLGGADWTRYKDGEIVLRLRRLSPTELKRSVKLDKPDTSCATNFKLELKTKTSDGSLRAIGLRQRIRKAHRTEQDEKGYFDLRVPIADFLLDVDHVHELVFVFENTAFLPTEHRGGLAIRGIALTTEEGQNVDHLFAANEE